MELQADGDKESFSDTVLYHVLSKEKELKRRLPWYYAPSFLLLWVALFFAVVLPLFYRLPDRITIADEPLKPGEFVAERAQKILYEFDRIGPKVVGSIANEVTTVAFLLNEVEKIRGEMRSDLFDLEVDVQQPSGSYVVGTMTSIYQGIQNVVVKLSTASSNSSSYLLINSHFDSKPGSPGAGDDGTMVVVMLEVLRQMSISETKFMHPLVFLFNGAEENPLQASHGFITQHKWAGNCKAVINLEVGGSGGRDILFQSGPNNPWLVKYYKQYSKHPFASTLAEEIFQFGILPSDTDFRIFRDYGNIPAQFTNGYVYHTAFDTFDIIPGSSIQSTGENILSLVRAFSNASELHNTEEHSAGHAVFFDFLGLFFVTYTEKTGVILNCCFAMISLVLIGCSLWKMASVSGVSPGRISILFVIALGLHLLGCLLCITLPLLMAVMYDVSDRTLTYYSNNWLVIGLYICPAIIGMVLPSTIYHSFKTNENLSHSYHIYIGLHAHCVVLSFLAIVLTVIGLRIPYMCMLSLVFYVVSLLINLLTTLHDRGYYWVLTVQIIQLFQYVYFCYLFYIFLVIFFPAMGRNRDSANPDMLIAVICAIGTFFALGFLVPLINMFRWSTVILICLGVVTFIFSMISVSDVGFPYRPKTSVMRVNFLQTRRMFYEYDGRLSVDDSGYYFDYQDRRALRPLKDYAVNLTGLTSIDAYCDKYVMCGIPCFWSSWCRGLSSAAWLPREKKVDIPGTLELNLLNQTVSESGKYKRFEFDLTGPPHMDLYIRPLDGVTVEDWSFIRDMLDKPEKYSPPYQIYFSYGVDKTPLKFYIDFAKSDGNFDGPLFELGVVGHYVNKDFQRDETTLQFIANLPEFVYTMEWPSLFMRYVF
ncbi:endoplasmic reticulum metallopeptidase 1-like isoform X2 [Drosophila subpulchrella]|uniref:endoplasmic reticulum metallopeptidase 1-like isoform X2 n=1 Tax=Drosophila subpulchrella TaxID=1486046 RepID=UPI0018A19358|nr:endoplasmic reticulum metallopeptidase 1-like isoform X2 [Drosophila subpulchrella]